MHVHAARGIAVGKVVVVVFVVVNVAATANAAPKGTIACTRSPGPSGAFAHGEMVVAEGEPGGQGANDEAGEEVDAMVAKVEVAREGNVDGSQGRHDGDEQEVDGSAGPALARRSEGARLRRQRIRVLVAVGIRLDRVGNLA